MQSLSEFKAAVNDPENTKERLRLQELALAIPPGYGSGAAAVANFLAVEDLNARLSAAMRDSGTTEHAYLQHVAFADEERAILSTLGLTANLFRSDSQ